MFVNRLLQNVIGPVEKKQYADATLSLKNHHMYQGAMGA